PACVCRGGGIAPAEPRRIGLVPQVCDAASLDDTLARIADDLLHGAPGAIATLKEASAPFASPPLSAILAHRAPHNPKSPEAIEGVPAFPAQRQPASHPQSPSTLT